MAYGKMFSFTGNGGDAAVLARDFYRAERGYGFLDYSASGQSPDCFTGTGGWIPAREGAGGRAAPRDTPEGVELDGKGVPLCFRAAVPEDGVYAVTASIRGGEKGLRGLNLYTGRRNLVCRDIQIAPGEIFTRRFFVRVCAYLPVVGKPPETDRSIYVSVLGGPARISGVRIESSRAPTLFLAGDSLVTDYAGLYPYNPLTNRGSWGQALPQYFDSIAVSNQAHGGLTTDCFRDDGDWEIVCRNLRPGDALMMEFGHNDQKRRSLKAFGGYAANLRWYIRKARERGANPILVTPMSRRPQKDEDGWYDLLEEYAQSCQRVGRELHVPVIDLHGHSFRLQCGMGTDAGDYFVDVTHTDDYGALLMADFLAEEIRRQRIEPLFSGMNGFAGAPWRPDRSLRPAGAAPGAEKEEKPVLPADLPELPYADCRRIRQLPDLKKAMARGLLDPCVKFFHPYAPLPRGQFLYLLFHAARGAQKRPYQGRFCDIDRHEFDAQYVQMALDADLVDPAAVPDDRFRPDDPLTGGELVSFLVRSLHPEGERNWDIPACERQAESLGLTWEGYARAGAVCRADCAAALVRMMELSRKEINALPVPCGR